MKRLVVCMVIFISVFFVLSSNAQAQNQRAANIKERIRYHVQEIERLRTELQQLSGSQSGGGYYGGGEGGSSASPQGSYSSGTAAPAPRMPHMKDKKEDFHDRREDRRDRKEDTRDRRENVRDRGAHPGQTPGIRGGGVHAPGVGRPGGATPHHGGGPKGGGPRGGGRR